MQLYDTDKDGKISGEELDRAPGLKASLTLLGTDKERGVTADQIAARIGKWSDSHVGRAVVSCIVMHNGQPLSGATVKFIPERFLADDLPETASGTTRQTGLAMISMPAGPGSDTPPGVPPGMYRVEITKDDEDIPAKYNAATVLGKEISIDNPEIEKGIQFDLIY